MELLGSSSKKSNKINIKKEIKKYTKYWPWFLLSLLMFFIASKLYLRYAQPQYFSKTTLKFEQTSQRASTQALNDLKNLGVGVSNEELDAETTVIISKPILMQVVKNLNLDVKYFAQGKIKDIEYYQEMPFDSKIISLKNADTFGGASYSILPLKSNTFKLVDASGKEQTASYGSIINLGWGEVQINLKPDFAIGIPIKIVFTNPKFVVSGLEGGITVSIYKSLLMDLSMVGPLPKKSEAILSEIIRVYNLEGIKDKKQESQFTANFIDKRLEIITDELSGIENKKEGVKREYQVTDLAAQAQMALQNLNEGNKALLEQATQLEIINSVYGLSGSKNDQLLPTGLGVSEPIEALISKYNDMVLVRNRTLKQATGVNPAILEMNKDISNLKGSIRSNLFDAKQSIQQRIGQLQTDIDINNGKINKFPTQEKIFRGIDRQQNLKEALFLFLLQKREENAINLAVALPKAKVVNPPYTTGVVAPKAQQIQAAALALGLLLPLVFFYIKNLTDTKIHTKDDVTHVINDATVIAEIPNNDEAEDLVQKNDFSVYAESFRILSSNLKYIIRAKDLQHSPVILITSSVKGEGKTTISMNLANSLSGNAKVLIIGADIRNPQLQRFVSKKNEGLTDYLVSTDTTPDNYIINSGVSDQLDVMFSGAKAPNPNDLLDMKKFDDMILHLRKEYDYVIMDSAPVMLVSDTLHLVEISDIILYVVKSDYTDKEMLDFASTFREDNKIQNMAFVLNNVRPEHSRYGNKYGYGYYNTPTKKDSILKRVFNKI